MGPLAQRLAEMGELGSGLESVLGRVNEALERGVEFRAASVHLVEEVGEGLALGLSVREQLSRRGRRGRGHVPMWAWAVFLGCGVLLAVLALLSWLLKGGSRLGGQKSAASGGGPSGGDKKWKAGFVGGMFLRRGKQDETDFEHHA